MILFCGIPSEPPLARAIEAARARELPLFVLNQRTLPFCDIEVRVDRGRISGTLWAAERAWALHEFESVYTRLIELKDVPELRAPRTSTAPSRELEKAAFVHDALTAWIDASDARVVNKSRPASTNGSKPLQAQLIRAANFLVPETLVTNDPDEVAAFVRRHRRVVYKSISSIRSIVRELQPHDFRSLHRIRNLPTQFQEYIAGTDIRVHVVADELFAVAVHSDATDYRYAERDGCSVLMEAITIPDQIADRCRLLARTLELPFCGIDLRVNRGDYYCFEVNPSPAYSYYEMSGARSIADALVAYLAGENVAGRAL